MAKKKAMKKTTKKISKKVVKKVVKKSGTKTSKKTAKKLVKKASNKKVATKVTKKVVTKTTKKVATKKAPSKKRSSLLGHEKVVISPRIVPSYEELVQEKKAVEERLMRIRKDLRSPLDQDADEQSLQLENREVLERLQDVEEENLLRINADLVIASK